MTNAQFTRKIEDFTCEFCGTEVKGNGYTDHCPNCLISKHVDINPGDRASTCRGLMIPVAIEHQNGKEYIVYECQRCQTRHRNKVSPKDNRDSVIAVAQSGGNFELYQKIIRQNQKSR